MNYNPNKNEIEFVNNVLEKFNNMHVSPENEAKKRGCHSVHVDTMSWQAPEFYKKHGYELISELDNIPDGYKKFHFVKEFLNFELI